MYVTAHARWRLAERIGPQRADAIADLLDSLTGEPGSVAYIVDTLPAKASARDGSNGDCIVAVAIDGSVETVYFRRSSQDMSPGYFGSRKVVDTRREMRYDARERSRPDV